MIKKNIKLELKQPERIDKVLAEFNPEMTRSQIQKIIKAGCVKINGQTAKTGHRAYDGDEVEIGEISTIETSADIITPEIKKDFKVEIIKETKDYLVVNKPSGLVTHGSEHIKEISLAEILVKKYPEIKKIGDDPFRPGIIHRIDKEVSGLLLVARNQKFFDLAKKQFQRRTIKKEYTALIHGQISPDQGEINFPIKRASSGHRMACIPMTNSKSEEKPEGRSAITQFEIEKKYINYTLLKVRIKTGRTHQIRAHLFAYGNSIVGDQLYATKKIRDKNTKLNLDRIFLVASHLEFKDTSGEKQIVEIKIPKELEKFITDKVR